MQAASLVPSSTTRYLEEIRRLPMLQADEESVLAKRWREHGQEDAARKLVTSHLRLVAKVALGYRGYGLPISELISEGNLGLMHATRFASPIGHLHLLGAAGKPRCSYPHIPSLCARREANS
jgi:DNA-directed RNA polymerase sigma subunit (sigma70/sigma32)